MAGRLTGRTIVITGAGSGIGRATAELFAAEGARLALLDRNADQTRDVAAALDAVAFAVDVSDEAQVRQEVTAAATQLGGIDGLVNCAGVVSGHSFEDTDFAIWQRIMAVNLNGPYLVCHAALPWLRKAERATIVNIASGQALLPSLTGSSYAASKAGLAMFTKCLAMELAPRIRANVVCPGATNTPTTNEILSRTDISRRQQLENSYALKRLCEADEIAAANLFLTSHESSAVTGIAMAVDCGRTFH